MRGHVPSDRTRADRTPGDRTLPDLLLTTTAALSLFLGTLLLGGCDNPACVFSANGCNGTSGGGSVGGNPASVPADGEWISPATPSVLAALPPDNIIAGSHTPIVLVFSESMSPEAGSQTPPPAGLQTAFQLTTTNGAPIPFSTGALVGDGRVLVLATSIPLPANSTFSLQKQVGSLVVDRTGQELSGPVGGVFGSFTIPQVDPPTPKVVATWPQDHATNQSGTGEIVVVFDRPIDPTTVDTDSFAVTVGGSTPANNPPPRAADLGNGPDNRVFVWQSVDAQGHPVDLGESASVVVTLSPLGHQIKDTTGAIVAAQNVSFTTAAFPAPLSAAITSVPNDAIGIDQISGPADLAIQVSLSGAQAGDFLTLTMFGGNPSTAVNPPLMALKREVALVAPFDSFTMTADEVDLLQGTNPVKGRLADGTVAFAFQLRRGSVSSPVRMLDVDATTAGVQSPILDTVPPQVFSLGATGTSFAAMRSDVRDVVLFGRASEKLTKALVRTALGDNETTSGVVPPVAGSTDSGTFVAAPVRLGVVDPANLPLDFAMTVYDRALNSAVVQSSTTDPTDGFRQLGASGPGTALPGGNVSIEVFDAVTLAPISNAEVYVHQELLGAVTAVNAVPVLTDVNGLATLAAPASGTTIVTVRKTSYDLFTFQGVPTSRVSVPLSAIALPAGHVTGTVGPISSSEATDLNTYVRAATDSRRLDTADPFNAVASCTPTGGPSDFECPFGPFDVRPGRIGAESAVTVRFPTSLGTYSPLTFLKTAAVALPLPSVPPSGNAVTNIPIPFLLDDGTLDPEELPIDAPGQMLSTDNWPTLQGGPEITVEATSPGLSGTLIVGRGVAFDASPPAGAFVVRAAYPGAADGIQDFPGDRLGSLVTNGTIDPDLFIGVEVADAAGSRAGSRPRFSLSTGFLEPPAVPVLAANPFAANSGGEALDLTFPDVLPDAVSPPGRGIYRVRISDSTGLGWTLYVPDPPDAAGGNVVVHLPDLAGVFPLASGPAGVAIAGWSWPGLDLSRFLWTDIDREHDLSFHLVAQTRSLP
jgi:hypothetical protein